MEIKIPDADLYIESRISAAAKAAGCYARIRWATPFQCRFTLREKAGSETYASDRQHDQVIGALFGHWPGARVRTALATYDGAESFQSAIDATVRT